MEESTMVKINREHDEGNQPAPHGFRVQRLAMRPGPGWKHLWGPVWEHSNKTRIHLLGTVRLPSMRIVYGDEDPRLWQFIKINGGNRKRGVMAYANSLVGV